jgi:hypothetical protein
MRNHFPGALYEVRAAAHFRLSLVIVMIVRRDMFFD